MSFKISILLSAFVISLVGCSFTPNELRTAEQIMNSKPDSALLILQHIKQPNLKFDSNRALYGLLLFRALDKNGKPLAADSLIDFSTKYYSNKNDKLHLAFCFFYKARIYKNAQRLDNATSFYIRALDCLQNNKEYDLLGKIHADMGDVCLFQSDYKEALKKYLLALECFNKIKDRKNAYYGIYQIGRTYRLEKKHTTAEKYYKYVLKNSSDSMLCGVVYQDVGMNFHMMNQYDSAQYYLRKSLRYPYRNTNYSIRCYSFADLSFDLSRYDSAHYYAIMALQYPANFITQRECYRILVNVEYLRKDIKQMGKYMTQYQNCGDSIRKIESQTKSTVLENLHNTTLEAKGSKRNVSLIVTALVLVLFLSAFLVYFLYRRNRLKKVQLDVYKQRLNHKQKVVAQSLTKKIEETKAIQANKRKNTSADQRIKLDKELYNTCLHLNNWDKFVAEMNQSFNQIVDKLQLNYPGISHKEIVLCCLQLIDIPHNDKILLLECTSDSLYKLKQRLAQKMNLSSTKKLDLFLEELIALND
jgi:tetratricopeptide (TPR) repeat protein